MKMFLFLSFLVLMSASSVTYCAPSIAEIDRIRIAEAYRIGEKLQNELWSDWSSAPFGILFISDDQEFLIRHQKPNDEFVSIGFDKLLKSEVFVRPRKFQKGFLATFPAFGSEPVIIIGKAENTSEKTSTRWIFVLLHEHFHQLQYSRPTYHSEVNSLDLSGGDTTGIWQINYPFPYKNDFVADGFRSLTDSLLAAYKARTIKTRSNALSKYLARRKVFSETLTSADSRYASFQLWQEGIARYTQYKMAELAGLRLRPSKAFRRLPDYVSFGNEAKRLHAATLKELHDLDLKEWQRVVFYPFGAVEGLLLDIVNPNWRSFYFNDKFAIERFYPIMKAK